MASGDLASHKQNRSNQGQICSICLYERLDEMKYKCDKCHEECETDGESWAIYHTCGGVWIRQHE